MPYKTLVNSFGEFVALIPADVNDIGEDDIGRDDIDVDEEFVDSAVLKFYEVP